MTHMSSADMSSELDFTRDQNVLFGKLFNEFSEFLTTKIGYAEKPLSHYSNSSSTLKTEILPFKADVYRVGDVLYGGKRGEYNDTDWAWNH